MHRLAKLTLALVAALTGASSAQGRSGPAAPGAGSHSGCSLRAPQLRQDTGRLVWSPGFAGGVERFVGKQAGVSDSFKDAGAHVVPALRGPAEKPVYVADGGWLYSACMAHVCPIKGVLLFDRDHRLRAAGVFDFICSPGDCPNQPRLDLFLRDTHDVEAQALLTSWAQRIIARDLTLFPMAAARRLMGVKSYGRRLNERALSGSTVGSRQT